jgi:hypothetical protein
MRQEGEKDIFSSVDVVTPDVLTKLGVTESMQEQAFMFDSRRWIRHMTLAGEMSAALDNAVELHVSIGPTPKNGKLPTYI